jgi:hypothetical protein
MMIKRTATTAMHNTTATMRPMTTPEDPAELLDSSEAALASTQDFVIQSHLSTM